MMVLASVLFAGAALERSFAAKVKPVAGGTIARLPYNVTDNNGSQWMIYPGGWMRQQGNMPLYGQAAMLNVNGNGMNGGQNQARLDDKTGELLFDETNQAGVMVSRRVQINKQAGYVRYIDIFRNPGQQDVSVNLQYNTNFNYGSQSSQMVEDPKKKDRQLACIVQTPVGRSMLEMYGARGGKLIPQITAPQDNNVVQATIQLTVPAGKSVALLHLHGSAASTDAAVQMVTSFKFSQLLGDIPLDLRKMIVNAQPVQSIGEREVLRGDLFDVIELRGGEDVLKGTIAEKSFKLQTFYGTIELPADRVVGLINVGQFRPRQLLVTVDGEVFGGTLDRNAIAMQLSSGQTTQVPLSQISRLGYRKRSGEPEEWTFDKPMVLLRSGERMLVALPSTPIDVMTRYGDLKLKPESVASVLLQSDEHGVHEITLTDGSRFAGLLPAQSFEMQLTGTSAGQKVSFPAATISKIQFTNKSPDELSPDDAATLQLTNQDQLIGTLSGQLKLDTSFDTITIDGGELRGLSRSPDAAMDVQAVLWDQTAISGQLQEPTVICQLNSGVSMSIPVPLIDHYTNPLPKPSASMIDRIKSAVADLSADDWKQRERAESQITSMGTSVISVLKEMKSAQPPEAQQRIDSILKELEKQQSKSAAGGGAGAGGGAVPVQIQD